MKPTIETMKLRVAGLLPDRLHIRGENPCWRINEKTAGRAVVDTELLEVCRLAVEKLDRKQRESYLKRLKIIVVRRTGKWGLADTDIVDATAEERIDAIYHAIRTPEEILADVAEYYPSNQ